MRKALLLSASLIALCATPSYAQQASARATNARVKQETLAPQSGSDVFKLGEISVSVVDPTTVVGSRNVVTAEEIATYDDSDTLDSAIALLPGVDISKVGRKNETSASIRGFEMRQITVMIDGVPTTLPYDAYPDLARVLTGDLSEIQVSKGLSSVLNGPNAMGGVINMVTRRPTKKFEGNLSLTAKFGDTGAYNGFRSQLNMGTNQGKWYVQAGASFDDISRWSVSDKYKPIENSGTMFTQKGNTTTFPLINENGGFRNNSNSKDGKLNFKLGLTPNDTDEYAIAYTYQSGETGLPVYAGEALGLRDSKVSPTDEEKSAFQLTRPFYRDYPYYDKQSIYTLTHTALGDTGYVKSRMFYDTYKNRMDMYQDEDYIYPDMAGGYPSFYDDYTMGASVEAGADLIPMNTTKIAFHYRRDNHKSRAYDADLGYNSPWTENVDDTFSVALEDTFHVTSKLDVIVGASYDWLNVKKSEEFDFLDENDKAKGKAIQNVHRQDDHTLNPMAALRYRYSDTGTVYAGVAQKSRFATQKARYSTRTGNGTGVPNPYLKAEKAINYEIGFSDTFAKRFSIDAAAFYSSIRDTNVETRINDSKYQTVNMGRSKIYGFELASRSKIADNFDLGLAYTFMIKDLDSPTAKERNLKPINAPKHKLTAFADWRVTEHFSIIPTVEAYSSRYSTIGGNNMVNGAVQTVGTSIGTGVNQIDGVKIGGFATAGIKLRYAPNKNFEIAAGVANIFDKNYELAEGYPEEGRNYYLTLTTKF